MFVLTLCLQASVAILILVPTYKIRQHCEYFNLSRDDFFPCRFAPGCHIAQQCVQAEAEAFRYWNPLGEQTSYFIPPHRFWKTA